MYVWIWRHLPGNATARAATMTVLGLAMVAALWFWVFPWAASHLPLDGIGFAV